MFVTLYFDTPAVITPAVTVVVARLGGLDLDNPKTGYREYTGYDLKSPKKLSNEDVLTIAQEVAALLNVPFVPPANAQDFNQVVVAVRSVAEAGSGEEPGGLEFTEDFNPKSTTNEDLVYGLLEWCGDGNNLENAATA